MDFDQVADELYGVPPEDFIAARRTREDEARAGGERVLAKSISQLPKPSLAAWATNLLVREHRDEIASLVELGGLLREAQESLAGDQLKALSVQRNQLLAALSRQVMALARDRGHPISSGVTGQVEETLRAAMADPDAGEAVLSARLTSPLSYSGLGTGQRPALRVVRPPVEAPPEKAPAEKARPATARTTAAEDRRRAAEERRRREEEAARREAEERRQREIAEAREAAQEAAAEAERAADAAEREAERADELGTRHRELQQRVDELMDELARTRQETTTVEGQLSRAQRKRTAAARRAEEAARERDRAAARLAELEG